MYLKLPFVMNVSCVVSGKSLFHEVTPIQTEDVRETLRQCGLNPTDIALCYPSHGTGRYISSFITFSTPEEAGGICRP